MDTQIVTELAARAAVPRPKSLPEHPPASIPIRGVVWPRPSIPGIVDSDTLRWAIKRRLAEDSLGRDGDVRDPTDALTLQLTRAAMSGDLRGTADLLLRAIEAQPRRAMAAAPLLERAADRLREEWLADRVSEFDVSIALCMLQTALRSVCAGCWSGDERGSVLVATLPGEKDTLGAALQQEVLTELGFEVLYRPLRTADDLFVMLESTPIDAVTFHSSPVFRRRERLAEFASLADRARAASRSRGLVMAAQGACFRQSNTDLHTTPIGVDRCFDSTVSVAAWLWHRLSLGDAAA
ncbi:hypothetical protein DFR50_112141 [Roseiarcus fermentans]|uniref:Uncharacterized protein n=1 Tax=Roseiarcus fermentans TaxID=1473586 RepID=A0A366FEW4_9HYPH|nr:hypothetical protein [Roseiarcus fermentans]RBP13167.1 hypothetical protein DFR50_112141 [Roseiarcus fermentans]